MELKNCPYLKSSLCCGKMDPEFVTWLQTACDAIVRTPHSQPIAVPQQYLSFLPAIEDVAAQYGVEVERKGGAMLLPTDHLKRPAMLLAEAITRFNSLIDGDRIHPARTVIRAVVIRRAVAEVCHGTRLLFAVYSQPQGNVQIGQGPDGLLGALLATEPV